MRGVLLWACGLVVMLQLLARYQMPVLESRKWRVDHPPALQWHTPNTTALRAATLPADVVLAVLRCALQAARPTARRWRLGASSLMQWTHGVLSRWTSFSGEYWVVLEQGGLLQACGSFTINCACC
jgi:hypothetical protein